MNLVPIDQNRVAQSISASTTERLLQLTPSVACCYPGPTHGSGLSRRGKVNHRFGAVGRYVICVVTIGHPTTFDGPACDFDTVGGLRCAITVIAGTALRAAASDRKGQTKVQCEAKRNHASIREDRGCYGVAHQSVGV
jgi:hypothetical protein